MFKVIASTHECAYREQVSGKYFCNHPTMTLRYCTWLSEFPHDCPLPTCKDNPLGLQVIETPKLKKHGRL
jgi:hypothetical protein